MSSQPQPSSRRIQKVRQACDCCHARKIRCDGENPCANCQITELQCTYLAVPKKKGPKGRRMNKDVPGARKPMKMPISMPQNAVPLQGIPLQAPLHNVMGQRRLPQINSPIAPNMPNIGISGFQKSPLVSDEMIQTCLDAFFTHKYPIMPILDRENIYGMIPHLHDLPEQYGLITALCAVIVLQPEILTPSSTPGTSRDVTKSDTLPSTDFLISETCRARQFCNHIENPSLATVQTSFFLFAALFCLGKDNSAWFYIRESMTMLQLQRLHEEITYSTMTNPQYSTYSRRTFWLLFITERAYALQRHRPLTLQRTISLPTVDPGSEARILSGFLDLVSLFQNFDDTFLSLWNLSTADSTTSAQNLVKLQDILKFAIPNVSERTEIQQADLLVSRQWLKTMVWQLCVSKGLLSSSPTTDESMSFHYPVTIARDVVLVSRRLPPKAFEANGVGILEKVFDIGCSLADVLVINPGFEGGRGRGLEVGPRDYLMELVRILGTVVGGGSKYLRLLAAKADECLQVGLRGSLSSSEGSHGIRELEDDEDFEEGQAVFGPAVPVFEKNGFEEVLSSRTGSVQDMAFDMNASSDFDHSNLVGIGGADMGPSDGGSQLPFSISTPEWRSMVESSGMAFGGTFG